MPPTFSWVEFDPEMRNHNLSIRRLLFTIGPPQNIPENLNLLFRPITGHEGPEGV